MSDGKDDGGAAPGRRRRSWTLDEKRRIIDESLEDAFEMGKQHLHLFASLTGRFKFGRSSKLPSDVAGESPRPITASSPSYSPCRHASAIFFTT